MTFQGKWQTSLLTGALALGLTAALPALTRAQDNQKGQQAGAQQQGDNQQAGRRQRGQGGAGGPGGPGGFARNPTQAVEQLQTQVKELNLSDEQKTKLEAIFKDESEQAKTLATEVESLQGRERAQKMMPFMRDLREKVTGVLNDEQKQTLRKNTVTRMAKQMTDRYRRGTAELGLSDDQKTKVDAVLADAEKKMIEAAPADGPIGGGVAAAGGGGGARGGPMAEITRDTREKVNAILTDEQKTKFQETMRQGRGQGGGGGAGRRGQGQGQGNQQ